jgi:hypothetical protein
MNGNAYVFDIEELARVGRAYSNVSTTIQTKLTNNNTIIEESNSTIHEGYEGSKPIREAPPTENNIFQYQQQKEQSSQQENQEQKDGLGTSQDQIKQKNVNSEEVGAFYMGTGAFMPSEILIEQDNGRLLKQGAYWSGSLWHCKHCKFSYDRPGMIDHIRLKHNQP